MSQLPFHLLELNVISAQDLAPVSKSLRTYAVTWINPERKLRTRIDRQGQINPTWNDKFVFRVDDKFLDSDTSAVMIEIFALGWLRDIPVGSVRVLISNLIPPSVRKENDSSRRFVALQVRRPSGSHQGILNLGVTLLDNTMRSMPLYTELSASAVGFQDLMEVKLYKQQHQKGNADQNKEDKSGRIQLGRTRSDQTDRKINGKKTGNKGSSLYEGSEVNGSVHFGNSSVNGSTVNDSIINGSEIGVPKGSLCDSDVGPSPSVVAAAVARGLYPTPLPAPHKPGSSILGDWTMEKDSSVEGLRSKIERWRTEFPPIHDTGYSSIKNNYQKVKKVKERKHARRHIEGGGSLFSCFGDSFGCEFRIVCGSSGTKGRVTRSCSSSKIFDSPVRKANRPVQHR